MSAPSDPVGPCPWGAVQWRTSYAPGLDYVSTAGHGGFLLSAARLASMPSKYRATAFDALYPHAFEHDASFCGVVLSFPELFPPEVVTDAREVFEAYYASKLGGKS